MAKCVLFCVFLCVQLAFCQFGFFPSREERRQNFQNFQNILNPNRIRNKVTGLFHSRPEDRESNSGFVFPSRPGGITNSQTGRPAYQDDQYGNNYNQYYPNQYGNNVVFPTNPTNNGQYPNFGTNVNFNPYGNQYEPGSNGNQYPNNPYQNNNNFYPNNQNWNNGNQYPNNEYGNNQYQPNNNGQYPSNNNQNLGQNQNNPQEIPNDPVNFEEPSSETPVDPVMVVNNPEDPIDNEKNPEQNEHLESGTEKPGQPTFTELPVLTPVPDTDKRNNGNFGTAGLYKETCQTVDNEIGTCISIQTCDPYYKVIKESRTNPQAVQLLRKAHCGFEGDNPKVCCPRPGVPTEPPQPATTTTTTTPQPVTSPPHEEVQPKTSGDYIDAFPSYPVCGKVTVGGLSRIVGGTPVKAGTFPWMTLLGYKPKKGVGASWLCGGTLVSSRHVLTAAHCIHNLEDRLFVVRVGEIDFARDDDGATPVDVLIKKKMKHEGYGPKQHVHDIGLLLLDKEVEFTDLIRPICLPEPLEVRSQSFVNYSPFVSGWGATTFRGAASSHLLVAQLKVVSNEECASAYSQYTADVTIDDEKICAGDAAGKKDACQGDSGGPLIQPIPNNGKVVFYQTGVVSFGKKCAERGFPGVYARVTHYIPWLQEKMMGISAQ